MKITYRERTFIDRFTCIDRAKTFKAISYFIQGGLYYFKTDGYNYRTIAEEDIISIEADYFSNFIKH